MATTHLVNGHDVIVPQLLARDTFVLELEAAAKQPRASSNPLIVDRAETVRAFESAPSPEPAAQDPTLVERSAELRLRATHDLSDSSTQPNVRSIT